MNKKLGWQLADEEIERAIYTIIEETTESDFHRQGKNIYIIHWGHRVRLVINSFTNRIIMA
ncbi:MAG: DUF3781 domain-containing protein, partial [Mangrovibacterium sp.]